LNWWRHRNRSGHSTGCAANDTRDNQVVGDGDCYSKRHNRWKRGCYNDNAVFGDHRGILRRMSEQSANDG
jgi:hypothetical protein